MKLNVLISGPLRPSEDAVCEVIESIRRQVPDSKIFLLIWQTECTRVKQLVDYYFEVPEPSDKQIVEVIHARTIQQRQLNLPDDVPCAKNRTYKMIYGVKTLCEKTSPYIANDEKVMRLRTDSVFKFDSKYLNELLSLDGSQYITKSGSGFDWFALTRFDILKKVWCFDTDEEYNTFVNNCWNPEDIIKRRIPVETHLLDDKRVDCYILRENGRKHYYN
jgi:hypothetical protein